MKAAIGGITLLLTMLLACGPSAEDRSQIERAMHHLNRKNYSRAAEILSREYERDPSNRRVAALLAQAHLGIAGFEMLTFAGDVLGKQRGGELLRLGVPHSCGDDAIEKLEGYDFRCLLVRIMRYLPDTEHESFVRARGLLRGAYPVVRDTPIEANFLSAVVELSSALGRVRSMTRLGHDLGRARMSAAQEDQAVGSVIRHAKGFLEELLHGFDRARHSYGKVSRHVVTLDGKPLIRAGRRELVFNEELSGAALLRFFAGVIRDEGRAIDDEINRALGRGLGGFGTRLVHALRALVNSGGGLDMGRPLELTWRLEQAIQLLADRKVDLFEFVWRHPPGLVASFLDAAKRTWRNEHPAALRDYAVRTRAQWSEAARLLEDWERWVFHSLSERQRAAIARFLRERFQAGIFPRLPEAGEADEIRGWYRDVATELESLLFDVFGNREPSVPPIHHASAEQGRELLQRSLRWMEENLWNVDG